jgi:hypothetical protein
VIPTSVTPDGSMLAAQPEAEAGASVRTSHGWYDTGDYLPAA